MNQCVYIDPFNTMSEISLDLLGGMTQNVKRYYQMMDPNDFTSADCHDT